MAGGRVVIIIAKCFVEKFGTTPYDSRLDEVPESLCPVTKDTRGVIHQQNGWASNNILSHNCVSV